jgi:hypothetical protein
MENNMWEKWTGNRKQLSEGAKIGKTGIVTFAASEVEKADVQEGDKYIIQRDKENNQIGVAFGNEGRTVPLNSDGSLTLNLRSVLASLDALPEKAFTVPVTEEDGMLVIQLPERSEDAGQ